MSVVTVEALMAAGAHFGHLTRRWNPRMRNFIFMERNGIHIIDLRKTQLLVDIAHDVAYDTAASGRGVLFVGTKSQAQSVMQSEAQRSNSNYVVERWLGGMLTNFSTIRRSIKRLTLIDKMESDGTFEKITKKERLMLNRERDRLRKVFGGIEEMTRLPGLIFIVDIKREHLTVKEARILGIPVIGIVDTNSDPSEVDYPIAANDDSISTIELISHVIADAIIEGRGVASARSAEMAAAGEQSTKESEDSDDGARVRRQIRQRRNVPARTEGGETAS